MDFDKIKRRQSLKVIISEAIMVLAVIITVIVLAFVVSGYWLNSDFKIERQGLLQISSFPTGADVEIDGSVSWLQKTNTSKVLSSGEHTVALSKENYDSWSKTINISEGLLYRINYPRLFLKNRSLENIYDTAGTIYATFSPNHETLLLVNETTEWTLINLNNDTLESKKLDVSKYFSTVSLADDATIGLFTGKISEAIWDRDGTHILFAIDAGDYIEWSLIDVKNVTSSLNLTKEFGVNFDNIKILDNSSNNLLVLQDGNLRKVDVSGKSISAVLVDGVMDYDYYNNEVVFSAKNNDADDYYIGLTRLGDEKYTELLTTASPAKVAISKFYDDKYISVLLNNEISLYKKDNFEKISSHEINFNPGIIKVGHDGEFIVFYAGNNIATLDMESSSVSEWQAEGDTFGWVDQYMIYSVADGELIVYDFDGLNRRIISKNVSARFPASITNDKWLYYFSNDNLIREWLIPR